MRRLASVAPWAFLPLLALLLASGCRANVSVAIEVGEDGSGTVTVGLILDDEAVDVVGAVSYTHLTLPTKA